MKVPIVSCLAVSLSVASTACNSPAAVHYAVAGSVSGPLLFRREGGAENDSIHSFVVRRVNGRYPGSHDGKVLWSAASQVARPVPDSIIYGLAPAGFVSGVVLPLTPGDYEIAVAVGNHSTLSSFSIDDHGHASR